MDDTDMSIARYGRVTAQDIGRRLVAARLFLGKTQDEMAAALGIATGPYGHRERGRNMVEPPEAWRLYETLGIPATFILFGDPHVLGPDWPRMKSALEATPLPESGQPARRGRPPKRPWSTPAE